MCNIPREEEEYREEEIGQNASNASTSSLLSPSSVYSSNVFEWRRNGGDSAVTVVAPPCYSHQGDNENDDKSESEDTESRSEAFIILLLSSYFHRWKEYRRLQLSRSHLRRSAVILSRQYMIRFAFVYFIRWLALTHQHTLSSLRDEVYREIQREEFMNMISSSLVHGSTPSPPGTEVPYSRFIFRKGRRPDHLLVTLRRPAKEIRNIMSKVEDGMALRSKPPHRTVLLHCMDDVHALLRRCFFHWRGTCRYALQRKKGVFLACLQGFIWENTHHAVDDPSRDAHQEQQEYRCYFNSNGESGGVLPCLLTTSPSSQRHGGGTGTPGKSEENKSEESVDKGITGAVQKTTLKFSHCPIIFRKSVRHMLMHGLMLAHMRQRPPRPSHSACRLHVKGIAEKERGVGELCLERVSVEERFPRLQLVEERDSYPVKEMMENRKSIPPLYATGRRFQSLSLQQQCGRRQEGAGRKHKVLHHASSTRIEKEKPGAWESVDECWKREKQCASSSYGYEKIEEISSSPYPSSMRCPHRIHVTCENTRSDCILHLEGSKRMAPKPSDMPCSNFPDHENMMKVTAISTRKRKRKSKQCEGADRQRYQCPLLKRRWGKHMAQALHKKNQQEHKKREKGKRDIIKASMWLSHLVALLHAWIDLHSSITSHSSSSTCSNVSEGSVIEGSITGRKSRARKAKKISERHQSEVSLGSYSNKMLCHHQVALAKEIWSKGSHILSIFLHGIAQKEQLSSAPPISSPISIFGSPWIDSYKRKIQRIFESSAGLPASSVPTVPLMKNRRGDTSGFTATPSDSPLTCFFENGEEEQHSALPSPPCEDIHLRSTSEKMVSSSFSVDASTTGRKNERRESFSIISPKSGTATSSSSLVPPPASSLPLLQQSEWHSKPLSCGAPPPVLQKQKEGIPSGNLQKHKLVEMLGVWTVGEQNGVVEDAVWWNSLRCAVEETLRQHHVAYHTLWKVWTILRDPIRRQRKEESSNSSTESNNNEEEYHPNYDSFQVSARLTPLFYAWFGVSPSSFMMVNNLTKTFKPVETMPENQPAESSLVALDNICSSSSSSLLMKNVTDSVIENVQNAFSEIQECFSQKADIILELLDYHHQNKEKNVDENSGVSRELGSSVASCTPSPLSVIKSNALSSLNTTSKITYPSPLSQLPSLLTFLIHFASARLDSQSSGKSTTDRSRTTPLMGLSPNLGIPFVSSFPFSTPPFTCDDCTTCDRHRNSTSASTSINSSEAGGKETTQSCTHQTRIRELEAALLEKKCELEDLQQAHLQLQLEMIELVSGEGEKLSELYSHLRKEKKRKERERERKSK